MQIPKYQWLMPEPTKSCGFCDEVLLPESIATSGNPFQVIRTTGTVNAFDFSTNPYDEVTSTNLDILLNTVVPFNGFQLYIEDKVYIFDYDLLTGNDYVIAAQIGNIYFIKVNRNVDLTIQSDIIRDTLADIVDVNHGTTTTLDLPTKVITIANIPAGSYINDASDWIDTVNTVTPSTNIGRYFYWDGSKICYRFVEGFISPNYNDPYFQFETSLTNGNTYLFQVDYSAGAINYTCTVTVDDGTNPVTTYTPTIDNTGTFTISYDCVLTSTHTIKIEIVDVDETLATFCINNIQWQTVADITDVEIEDCDGNVTPIDYTLTETDTATVLIEPDFSTFTSGDVFRLILTDSENNVFTSRYYKVGNQDCNDSGYYEIAWTHDCRFGDIRYDLEPFTNRLLLSGVLLKLQSELVESVDNVTADGRKISIYKNTQSVYELRLHPYLSDTMDNFEKIFDHSDITVNGTTYNATDILQVSELDLGIYTGRVDLYKPDTAVIVSKCCC